MQGKKKSVALKGTQGDSSTEDSAFDDDDDFALVITKANMMMRRKFYKKGFRKRNSKKIESRSSACFEYNKPGHIKKDCPISKDKSKKSKMKRHSMLEGMNQSQTTPKMKRIKRQI